MQRGTSSGRMVAFVGLPGSGKSTLAGLVAKQCGCRCYLEPEEDTWPPAVIGRETFGAFTAISWFRSVRVPMLYQALAASKQGETVIVDSYYDKLLGLYLGKPGMEWLIDPHDPYFELVYRMAALDLRMLPDADVIVFLRIDRPSWHTLLKARRRELDGHQGLLRSFQTQEYFYGAAQQYCKEMGTRLITIARNISDPLLDAREISDELGRSHLIRGVQ